MGSVDDVDLEEELAEGHDPEMVDDHVGGVEFESKQPSTEERLGSELDDADWEDFFSGSGCDSERSWDGPWAGVVTWEEIPSSGCEMLMLLAS